MWLKWSANRNFVAKVLLAIWYIFFPESNPNYNSYRFTYKFPFIHFFSFLETKKKNKIFSKLVVRQREIFLFFVYSESLSTSKPSNSKPCGIQHTFIKEFSFMLFLLLLYFHDWSTSVGSCSSLGPFWTEILPKSYLPEVF